jgi:hypothetical protein
MDPMESVESADNTSRKRARNEGHEKEVRTNIGPNLISEFRDKLFQEKISNASITIPTDLNDFELHQCELVSRRLRF